MASSAARPRAIKTPKPQHRQQPDDLFEVMSVYTTDEIAAQLHVSPTAVRNWLRDGKLDPSGIIDLPRGRRVYGWALNQFVRDRRG